jgi:hypothetical protein
MPGNGLGGLLGGAAPRAGLGGLLGGAAPRAGLGGLLGGAAPRAGLGGILGGLTKSGINWGGLLTNTQKTLSIINQAIPVFYQVKPIWNNAKTMFRVMGEMGKINNNRSSNDTQSTSTTTVDSQSKNTNETKNEPKNETKNETKPAFVNEPQFFI